MPARFVVLDRVGAPPPPPPPPPPTPTEMLMGVDDGPNTHGGYSNWDVWRCYTQGSMLNKMNLTGSARPLAIAYSEQGNPQSGSYATIRAHWLGVFDTVFYVGGASSQTHSGRWGIKLYVSNGNENSDKGMLATQTTANLALWMDSQKALYDAVHYIDPTTGLRRYPDAYAGSNPTHEHEKSGIVAWWLMPSARYHDFVMWSMYPPGRTNTVTDPTYNWPSFNRADRTDGPLGFLVRCFDRTDLARAQARIDTGDPTRELIIGCGETAIASDPGDATTRPYYTAHGLAGAMYKLSVQYAMVMGFACWWDRLKDNDVTNSHNLFADEGTASDHGHTGVPTPTTVDVWRDWRTYDKRIPGVTLPGSWAGNPKSGWKHSGAQV